MADTDSTEVHIASFIVHFHDQQRHDLDHYLAQADCLEGQPEDPAGVGKRVVVCEGPHPGYILDRMEEIEHLPGVLGCSMVYHEVMDTREADQQMITEVKSA